MADLVRKSRPQNPDQPSLFLSLNSTQRLFSHVKVEFQRIAQIESMARLTPLDIPLLFVCHVGSVLFERFDCGPKVIQLVTFSRLRNSDGRSGFWGRLFRTRSVMGRLWDDHFRDLGHPPKIYRVQDAGFIDKSSNS